MKIKKMQKICHDHKGICKECPLNANKEWEEKLESWCMIQVKQNYIKAYKKYKEEHNDILAERTMMQYKQLEQKYNIKGD